MGNPFHGVIFILVEDDFTSADELCKNARLALYRWIKAAPPAGVVVDNRQVMNYVLLSVSGRETIAQRE